MTINILFASGGTGGHIAPAISILEHLEQEKKIKALFLGTNRVGELALLDNLSIEHKTLNISTNFYLQKISLLPAIFNAINEIKKFKPKLIIATGGYVSAPSILAAKLLQIPSILVNIDIPPGKSNKLLSKISTCVLSTCPINHPDITIINTPIRKIALSDKSTKDARKSLGLHPDKPTLLITGASQGANSLNITLPKIREKIHKKNWQVIHLTGSNRASLRAKNDWGTCSSIHIHDFITNIGDVWKASSLAISRAGANSVAESEANKCPTIFVPYPHHKDNHQEKNALPLVEKGIAIIAKDPLSNNSYYPSILDSLNLFLENPKKLKEMLNNFRADIPIKNNSTAITNKILSFI